MQQQTTVSRSGALTSNFHTVENDAYSLRTSTTTSDALYSFVPAGAGFNFVLDSLNASDSNAPTADTYQYAYATPMVLDELPETNGAVWSNSGAVTITEKDADGTTATRIYKADGSYTEAQNQPGGQVANIAENADGGGSYGGSYLFTGTLASLTFSAPSPVPSAPPQITIALNFPPAPTPDPSASPGVPTPSPAPTPQTLKLSTWYGSAPTLYAESDTVATGVAFPATCSVPSGYGTNGADVKQTIDKIDTILGYKDHTVTDSYVVQGFGPVCVLMADTQTNYYDYLNDTQFSFVFSHTPISTSTISETLTLQPGATIRSAGRKAQSSAGAISLQTFAAGRARFANAIERERHNRVRALTRYFKRAVQARAKGSNVR